MTTPLPPSAIEAEEWYPGTRRLMGNQDGPFLLVAFQDASATVPIKWEALCRHGRKTKLSTPCCHAN